MKAVFSAMRTIAGISSLCAVLLLGLVIWLFTPSLAGGSLAWGWRLLLASLPLLVWLGVIVLAVRRARKRDAALVAAATEVDEGAAKAQVARVDEPAIAERLADALRALKAAGGKGRGGFLYERPWYVLIGPPGSGKTTAIRNSGLKFPFAEGKVAGVGGTRNCDWWISEQAVLIDTAGRYTTQDSEALVDKAGWDRFLDLLRRERPRQPLNGIVVSFGVDMLSRLDSAGREQHAHAIRLRVRELEQRLGQRLPVYLLISKADLVAGFTEFFDDLDAETRRQVWGVTFPPPYAVDGAGAGFRAEFNALVRRLNDRLLERLQGERGALQRVAIAGFPAQFASLEESISAFVQVAFSGSKLDPAPYLRGVYFTSGTQDGSSIDRLAGALSRAFGLEPSRQPATVARKGRSYFLGRLLLDVVFNEASLALRNRSSEQRRKWVWLGSAVASGLVLLGGVAWGAYAVNWESDRAGRLSEALEPAAQAAQQLARAQPLERVRAADDAGAALPYLNRTRMLAEAAAGSGGSFGISQEAKLDSASEVAYRRALERVWLPRLLVRLEGQIRGRMQEPDYLYMATRVYLMLGRQGPLDAPLIQDWMQADWALAYPGAVNAASRERMQQHLQELLNSDFATHAIDGVLVDNARRVFSRLPLENRIYSRMRTGAGDVPPWLPAKELGLSGAPFFTVQGGAPLEGGRVPGLFTVQGLYLRFLPGLPKAIKEAEAESWVLGPAGAALASDPMLLEAAVMRLYAKDYVAEWQKMLDSLVVKPLGTPTEAAAALNLLGAPNSPLRDLLHSIAVQLNPAKPPALPAGAPPAASAVAGARRAAELMGLKAGANPVALVDEAVSAKFKPLRDAAAGPSLDRVLAALSALYLQVSQIANSPPGSAAPAPAAGGDPGLVLAGLAQGSPEPLRTWLNSLNQSSNSVRRSGTSALLAAASGQDLKPFCQNVEARFPFNRTAAATDMPIGDFVHLFGSGGALDQFFTQNLKDKVEIRPDGWRPAMVGGVPAAVSASDVLQFQRAAAIRKAFFPMGQPGGALRFELVPMGGAAATLSVEGGAPVVLVAGGRPIALHWPAPGRIALAFDGEPAAAALAYDGPWAALRLVMLGKVQPTNVPDRMRLTLQSGGKSVEFELRANSIVHPFALPDLTAFRCPRLGS